MFFKNLLIVLAATLLSSCEKNQEGASTSLASTSLNASDNSNFSSAAPNAVAPSETMPATTNSASRALAATTTTAPTSVPTSTVNEPAETPAPAPTSAPTPAPKNPGATPIKKPKSVAISVPTSTSTDPSSLVCDANPIGTVQERIRYQFAFVDYADSCDKQMQRQSRSCQPGGTWSDWQGTFTNESCQNSFSGIKNLAEVNALNPTVADKNFNAVGISSGYFVALNSTTAYLFSTSNYLLKEAKSLDTVLGLSTGKYSFQTFNLKSDAYVRVDDLGRYPCQATTDCPSALYRIYVKSGGTLAAKLLSDPKQKISVVQVSENDGKALLRYEEGTTVNTRSYTYLIFNGVTLQKVATTASLAEALNLDPTQFHPTIAPKSTLVFFGDAVFVLATNGDPRLSQLSINDYARTMFPVVLFELKPGVSPRVRGTWLKGYLNIPTALTSPILPVTEGKATAVYHRMISDVVGYDGKVLNLKYGLSDIGGGLLHNNIDDRQKLVPYFAWNLYTPTFPYLMGVNTGSEKDHQIPVYAFSSFVTNDRPPVRLGVLSARSNCMYFENATYNQGCDSDVKFNFLTFNNEKLISYTLSPLSRFDGTKVVRVLTPSGQSGLTGEPLKKRNFLSVDGKLVFLGAGGKLYVYAPDKAVTP